MIDWNDIHIEWEDSTTVKAVVHLPTGVQVDGPWTVTPDTSDREHIRLTLEGKVHETHHHNGETWQPKPAA